MTDIQINALAADIREIDGNHDKGAGELAEALVAKGWVQESLIPEAIVSIPTERVTPVYESSESVEILFDGEWVPGHITEITAYGLIHVHTERGGRTLYASSTKIRKI